MAHLVEALCYKPEGRGFDGVIGIFHWRNHSGRTMALGLTQPLTDVRTRRISWGQRRPARKVDNLPPSCTVVTKSGNLNFLEPSGQVQACKGIALPFYSVNLFSLPKFQPRTSWIKIIRNILPTFGLLVIKTRNFSWWYRFVIHKPTPEWLVCLWTHCQPNVEKFLVIINSTMNHEMLLACVPWLGF